MRWGKIKEKIKVKACSRGQLITSLERLLNEIRKGYLAIGDSQVNLPRTADLKMELEEKNGRVEFELELTWSTHLQEEEQGFEERQEGQEKQEKQKDEDEEKEEEEEEEEKTSSVRENLETPATPPAPGASGT